ncbi:IclR family transcriptional regulator C-terminal domain-containing protein [Arthrobacter jinronghuae]|uniref:Helix-turn-helix domain-containing protein n=1 Tax=Arthrobacter jinronghuae TaxID=2964609 RepID=A0ABT1NQU7_9MICC|nr:IclR family transcriptional regulator C-terminal domain-containing protein [Arthrobacter jinronghuae]MCQ1950108.1 helix-turn-helix domain-containing protein [Arthrobacter jinronghuae]MCQ1953494.1 helix-turn-helix domain-containing protein [Arthrobacter sp. zg-Y238]MCQ1956726.1 helix-turn-helix domain-containing protein [Arthrobacter jinronghuae]UWX77098.1 helix-turn-helix domain-containing protein [Arthrobacter jinronghuae]
MEGADGYYVKSVEKAFAVLGAFTLNVPEHTVSSAAAAAGISRAASRRFLLTLRDLGYLGFDGTTFRLAPRTLDIGSSFLAHLALPHTAEPHLKQLSADLGETTSLCILDGTDVVYVSRITSPRLVRVAVNVGTRFPAWATSMGRVLLASLPEAEQEDYFSTVELLPYTGRTVRSIQELRASVREAGERGWSRVADELEDGLRGVAVPVRSGDGTVVAAANVSLQLHSAERVEETVLPPLRAAADRIGRDLG